MINKKKHPTIADIKSLPQDKANFVIEYCKDLDARRAATASGFPADDGYKIRDEAGVALAIQGILQSHLSPGDITPEWLLQEFYYNHLLARQRGNITASNQCLNLIAKHAAVDAYAAEKVQVDSDEKIMQRLLRRERAENLKKYGMPPDPPHPDDMVSFL